jgi:hypothetical protein
LRLARCEREATASIVAHLAELDARELYLAEGFSCLFNYCLEILKLSEDGAYNRIAAARAARKFPVILDKLADGSLNLTTVRLLAPHLTRENHAELLAAASGKRKRQVEELLARCFPQPPVPSSIRKLPTPAPPKLAFSTLQHAPSPPPVPAHRPIVAPLAPERYRVQFTASAETYKKLRRAQDLLRHQFPDGDPGAIIDRALTLLLDDLARKKLSAADRPRSSGGSSPGSRHIPAEVKRAVLIRDGEQCAFVAASGRRCGERGMLEFHHVKPYAAGGQATVENIQMRCKRHNAHEAERYFGPRITAGDTVREDFSAYGRGTRDRTRPGTGRPAAAIRLESALPAAAWRGGAPPRIAPTDREPGRRRRAGL